MIQNVLVTYLSVYVYEHKGEYSTVLYRKSLFSVTTTSSTGQKKDFLSFIFYVKTEISGLICVRWKQVVEQVFARSFCSNKFSLLFLKRAGEVLKLPRMRWTPRPCWRRWKRRSSRKLQKHKPHTTTHARHCKLRETHANPHLYSYAIILIIVFVLTSNLMLVYLLYI